MSKYIPKKTKHFSMYFHNLEQKDTNMQKIEQHNKLIINILNKKVHFFEKNPTKGVLAYCFFRYLCKTLAGN
jgi:hypothetical protein